MNIIKNITKFNKFRGVLFTSSSLWCYNEKIHSLKMSSLDKLKFDNLVLRTLPLDKSNNSNTRTVPRACFSLVNPTPIENPELVAWSQNALNLLDISSEDINDENFAEYFSANKIFDGSETAAHCYCGHQFGYFSGQLGDGAAMYLGEVVNTRGERWELQLKGAGKTPYSRHADGRKVLRSSIREFLCSEAMHYLGIPTTRAGTCITSDSRVVRDIFYDGHPQMERCTVVSRIAPTFLRFGSFEIFKRSDPETGRSGPSAGETQMLHTMLQYAINTFFPDIAASLNDDQENCYLEFYKEVVRRTAKLIAQWQCVGFCHGVLNTDNMSILGLTIDYGPFGFMDYFDPNFICNASDNQGRYSYINQPEICKWNLLKFAEALQEALPLEKSKQALDEIYGKEFSFHYYDLMRKKLGLTIQDGSNDEQLIQKLLWTMRETSADFTNTFRLLAYYEPMIDKSEMAKKLVTICETVEGLKKKSQKNSNEGQLSQLKAILQLSITNSSLLSRLGITADELKRVIEQGEKHKEYAKLTQDGKTAKDEKLWNEWLTDYSSRLEKEICNCDDTCVTQVLEERRRLMNSVNPSVILRNHLAQDAIEAAESGDYSKVRNLLKRLEQPFDNDQPVSEEEIVVCTNEINILAPAALPYLSTKYTSVAPLWATDLCVT